MVQAAKSRVRHSLLRPAPVRARRGERLDSNFSSEAVRLPRHLHGSNLQEVNLFARWFAWHESVMKFHRLLLLCLAVTTVAAEKPNFIFINTDDLGYADIGPFGSKLNRTPNLDRMAK